MANEIYVDPAVLRRHGEEIDKCYTALRSGLYSSAAQMKSLDGIWTGAAADTFRASFQRLLDQCAESLNTVGKMGATLYESADAYERGEKAVQKEASELPKLPGNLMR